MLWTAYVSGGNVPRGQQFVRAVEEIAQRVVWIETGGVRSIKWDRSTTCAK